MTQMVGTATNVSIMALPLVTTTVLGQVVILNLGMNILEWHARKRVMFAGVISFSK